jgi:hypothetical protein
LRTSAPALTGVIDEWPIQREPFTQWVVEDVPAMRDADWHRSASRSAKDVSVYDRAKLRLLNGPHSTLAYLGLLRGHESVADAMRDEQLAQFVELLMTEDLAPSLGATPGLDVAHYISAVLRAFAIPESAPAEPDRLGRLQESCPCASWSRSPKRYARVARFIGWRCPSPHGCVSSCGKRKPASRSSIRMPRVSRAWARMHRAAPEESRHSRPAMRCCPGPR